jgi:hypothetical protein
MKRFFILAAVALFSFACAQEQKVTVEQTVDGFNARMVEIHQVVDIDAISKEGGINLWFDSLDVQGKQNIAQKCKEFVALQKEMTEWRKTLNQDEIERVKVHMRSLNNPQDVRKVNLMHKLMLYTRNVK